MSNVEGLLEEEKGQGLVTQFPASSLLSVSVFHVKF